MPAFAASPQPVADRSRAPTSDASRIAGTGSYLPEKVLTNAELAQRVDTSDEWIRTRTGIRKRHIAAPHEADLATWRCTPRARRSRRRASRRPTSTSSSSPRPRRTGVPVDGVHAAGQLGTHGCAGLRRPGGLHGFRLRAGGRRQVRRHRQGASNALVVGAETFSRILDWEDRGTCVLFGDGAGAVVVGAVARRPGSSPPTCMRTAPTRNAARPRGSRDGRHGSPVRADARQRGVQVRRQGAGRSRDETLEATGMTAADIDWLIPHQANIRIIQATARKLTCPGAGGRDGGRARQHLGRVDPAGARHRGARRAHPCAAQHVMLLAVGGGFTWGSVFLTMVGMAQ